MIGLPDDIAMDGGDAAHGPQRFATRASCYLNPEKWAKVVKFSGARPD
jgi:hypothetical protein